MPSSNMEFIMKMNIKKVLVLGSAMTILATTSVFAAPANNRNNGGDNRGDYKARTEQRDNRGDKKSGGKKEKIKSQKSNNKADKSYNKGDRGNRNERGQRGDRNNERNEQRGERYQNQGQRR